MVLSPKWTEMEKGKSQGSKSKSDEGSKSKRKIEDTNHNN
jgi:hypothetical protein